MADRTPHHDRELNGEQEQRVRARMAQLLACEGEYSGVDVQQAARRLEWWDANRQALVLTGSLPRQGYTLFLLSYLHLQPDEVPVVYEDEEQIVWRSYNFCPTLEACLRLGLDTREVCRRGTEQSVQTFIACLDSRLRFSRNYRSGIRPYTPYCEESISLAASKQR